MLEDHSLIVILWHVISERYISNTNTNRQKKYATYSLKLMPADTSEFTPDMLVEFNITLHMQYCVLHLNRATQKQSCF